MSSHTGQNKQSVETGSVLESFAYSKGDQAKTIKEFKQALKGDYTVSFNGNARNAEKFLRRITVYGENHIQPNLPSIPSDRGLIMFESQDPERCIKKYMAYESNRCISIDQPDLSSESTALGRLKSAYISVLDEIGPQAVAQVEAQLGVRATVQEFMLKALHYATTKMSEISASGDEDRLNRIMEKMETAAEVSAQSRMKVESRIGVRDDHMFEQAASNIRNLSNDEAATIVVGDNHADKLFARLNAAFPERAVVKCKVAKEAWPVA